MNLNSTAMYAALMRSDKVVQIKVTIWCFRKIAIIIEVHLYMMVELIKYAFSKQVVFTKTYFKDI